MNHVASIHAPAAGDGAIVAGLVEIFAEAMKTAPGDLSATADLSEIGVDSLVLFDVFGPIKKRFGVGLSIKDVSTRLRTIDSIAAYIGGELASAAGRDADARAPAPPAPPPPSEAARPHGGPAVAADGARPAPAPAPTAAPAPLAADEGAPGLQGLIQAQLQLMALQLEVMGRPPRPGLGAAPANGPDAPRPTATPAAIGPAAAHGDDDDGFSYLTVRAAPDLIADATRRAYLAGFVERYNRKTRGSKALAQRFRHRVADVRNAIGFTRELKELNYPIVARRMKGARAWDDDDNEYVDMTMGYGTHLLGHDPDGLAREVAAACSLGVGARNELALEAAELLAELTGMDRVLFVNDGTEAVMSAVKAARARTGRRKVVIFDASYHGHWDGVLAHRRATAAAGGGDPDRARPMFRGVTPGAVADTVVFPFGGDEVFAYLAARGREVAAVLIEPVPHKDPGLLAPAFLARLREATTQTGALLIFDEIVTGFRCHPGGVQARLGVRADLVTYGKVAGGGLPLGAVAGRGDSLDAVDGGPWSFGDASFPAADTTMIGGTFFQHPASMAAARFVLRALRSAGPALQERVERRALALLDGLNDVFRRADAPMEARGFSSFFRVFAKRGAALFYYDLIDRGVYSWEWRGWFLSDAHGQREIDFVLDAARESIAELQRHGLL
jgi:glutamate-1-semialdehyde aminotransferase/acyl carrier protein